MELYTEILAHALSSEQAQILFPELKQSATDIVEMRAYQALQKIKEIIEDDTIADDSCFERIEQIVCVFEEIGSSGGTRHDFG